MVARILGFGSGFCLTHERQGQRWTLEHKQRSDPCPPQPWEFKRCTPIWVPSQAIERMHAKTSVLYLLPAGILRLLISEWGIMMSIEADTSATPPGIAPASTSHPK